MPRSPRTVAELGRPETPEETAARKAEASRRRRSNQTGLNLVLALGASLGIVLLLVLVVVRPDPPSAAPVDYSSIASEAEAAVGAPLADPVLPPAWVANSARLTGAASDIPEWTIGFVTPESDFLGIRQGVDADATWLDDAVESMRADSVVEIDGITWDAYDNREDDDPGNLAYALSATVGRSTYVLYGTAADEEFRTLASSLAVLFAAEPSAPRLGETPTDDEEDA